MHSPFIRRILFSLASIALFSIALSLVLAVLTVPALAASFIDVNPGDSIQAAINSAHDGDTILIHIGAYTESVTLNKALSLIGDDRATTIINAVSNQRVTTVTGALISNTVIISGLTFTRGSVTGNGGGLLIKGNAQPLLQNLIIANNHATDSGGGVYAETGSPLTMIDVNVHDNSSVGSGAAGVGGGGVWAADVTSMGGRFENNVSSSSRGGGLYADRTLTLSGTQFISNSAALSGGGAHVMSATIALNGWFEHNLSNDGGGGGGLRTGQLIMTNTTFINNVSNNTMTGGGGAIVVSGASMASSGAAIVNGGSFIGNVTNKRGGGLVVFGPLKLTGTRFIANVAQDGGGLSLERDGDKRVVNAVFARNTANGVGSALFASLNSGHADVLQTTIASPTVGNSSAIVVTAGSIGLTNTIVASYTTGIQVISGTVYADYDLLFGNTVPTSGTINGGAHHVNGDPMFAAPNSDDYHLITTSAAINRGIDVGVLVDADGRARLGPPDIGAYESIPPFSVYLPLVLK